MHRVDLNCDMGESSHVFTHDIENDNQLLQSVSSANIACGFHAGDPSTMHQLVKRALDTGVAIGAHPGFADRDNFGRKEMWLSPEMVYDLVLYQLGALGSFLKIHGASLHHVKPHGALYNMAGRNTSVADAITRAVKDFDSNLILYALSGSEMIRSAARSGLKTASEVFADRTYQENGMLTPRSLPGAVIEDDDDGLKQVLQMILTKTVTTTSGKIIGIDADTICIHGDGRHAVEFARKIKETLAQHQVTIAPS